MEENLHFVESVKCTKYKKDHKCASVLVNADMHVSCEHLGWYTLGDIITGGTKYLSSPNAQWSSAGLNNFACLHEAGAKSASFTCQSKMCSTFKCDTALANFPLYNIEMNRCCLMYISCNICPTRAHNEVCPHLTPHKLSSSVQSTFGFLVQNCSIGRQIHCRFHPCFEQGFFHKCPKALYRGFTNVNNIQVLNNFRMKY